MDTSPIFEQLAGEEYHYAFLQLDSATFHKAKAFMNAFEGSVLDGVCRV